MEIPKKHSLIDEQIDENIEINIDGNIEENIDDGYMSDPDPIHHYTQPSYNPITDIIISQNWDRLDVVDDFVDEMSESDSECDEIYVEKPEDCENGELTGDEDLYVPRYHVDQTNHPHTQESQIRYQNSANRSEGGPATSGFQFWDWVRWEEDEAEMIAQQDSYRASNAGKNPPQTESKFNVYLYYFS